MASEPLFDMSLFDPDRVLVDIEGINAVNPQRFEFQQLHGVCYIDRDAGHLAGVRNVREDEFWVRGHIPGRPIFPGVLMVETSAQLVSYYIMSTFPERGFMGFGAVTDVKFRGAVVPGQRIVMLAKTAEIRKRRAVGLTQAWVDGKLVYEGTITGMWM